MAGSRRERGSERLWSVGCRFGSGLRARRFGRWQGAGGSAVREVGSGGGSKVWGRSRSERGSGSGSWGGDGSATLVQRNILSS
jgi:hypothetical protein